MKKTAIKVELVWQDVGYCVNYYKVVGGKNDGYIICATDIMDRDQEPKNWYSCANEVEGDPCSPINMEKCSIEVIQAEKVS